ncbi:MAG: glycosyltransferase [Bacteriovorax sp.]|nr:glycosyltransferase [Bacteriovorax sp.]
MKICIVSTDLQGFVKNGGVGTANSNLAKYLAKDHQVEILFCHHPQYIKSFEYKMNKLNYEKANIKILALDYPIHQIDTDHIYVTYSYLVFEKLKGNSYDKILFPEMHGLGYYCMRAKELNIAFAETELITFFHGPSQWHIENNNGIPTSFYDLMTFYIEKMTCQLADRVLFATEYAKEVAQKMDYLNPNTSTNVLLFPFDKPQGGISITGKKSDRMQEICFFGRLESRKGILIFLKASLVLSKLTKIKISLIGRFGFIDSQPANEFLSKWSTLNNVNLNIQSNFSKQEAIDYLKEPGRLTVICSLEETMGYTLIECITENIPFVCTDIKPFKEIIEYFKSSKNNIFKKENFGDLVKLILSLKDKKLTGKKISEKILKDHAKKWVDLICRENEFPVILTKENGKSMISFCVVYNDRPQFLTELIDSLSHVKNKEVNIYINNSTSLQSIKLIKEIAKLDFVRMHQDENNVSPGKARNYLASKANYDLLFFIDDDNILNYQLFNQIINKINLNWDLLVFPLAKFHDEKLNKRNSLNIISKVLTSVWVPIGNDINFNINTNRIGDGNLIIKKKHFLQLKGFNETLLYGEDQDLLLRSKMRNGKYALLPDSMIFYRIHKNNLSISGERELNIKLLRETILKNLNIFFLKDFFSVYQAWDYEKDRNPGRYQLNEIIQHIANPSLGQTVSDSIRQLANLKKIVRNDISFDADLNLTWCKLKPHQKTKLKKQSLDKFCEFNIYSSLKGEIFINGVLFKLPIGNSILQLKYTEKEGIVFMDKDFSGELFIQTYKELEFENAFEINNKI